MRFSYPKLKLFFLVAGILWVCIITVLLLIPGDELPPINVFGYLTDKISHASVYGLLTLLFALYMIAIRGENLRNVLIIALLCTVHGILMEFAQKYLTVNRAFDVWDMVADALGCFAIYLLYRVNIKNKPL